jgi:allophanate hydrolase subunit 1
MTVTTDAMVIGRVTDYGDAAVLLQFDSTAEVLAWADVVRDADLLGVVDIVPASRTVLIKLDGPRYQGVARQQLSKLRLAPESLEQTAAPIDGRADVVIDVVYDGADLGEVADLTGLTPREVVAAHTQTPWRVGFAGFAPGFGYLVGGDERLKVPRRS